MVFLEELLRPCLQIKSNRLAQDERASFISPPLPSDSALSGVADGWNAWNVPTFCLMSFLSSVSNYIVYFTAPTDQHMTDSSSLETTMLY